MIYTVIDAVTVFALELFYSVSITYFFGGWAIDFAYRERGYVAYGGEYLLIIFCFIISFRIISKFFKHYRR